MRLRTALACALGLAACDGTPNAAVDAGDDRDTGELADADAHLDDADPGSDAPTDDTTAPQVVVIAPAPASDVWLHEPIHVDFDEPIQLAGASVSTNVGAATLAKSGDRTLVVRVAPSARAIGTLSFELAGVRDEAGNIAAPIEAQFTLAPWQRSTLGPATTSPALAVADSGVVVAAWASGSPGTRRIVVQREDAGAWQPLGTLGTADSTSPAIAIDASDRPIVAWIESGQTRVVRLEGASWVDLPSLGAGSAIALAVSPSDTTIAALVVGSAATVSTLGAGAWQPVGGSIALGGALTGSPAIAVGDDSGAIAVGWIANATLRVHRHTSAWQAMQPITASASRLGLAARGSALALAWDDRTGSSGVYAATASGTVWTRLGHALDVDVAGDASAPAIAIDASSQPVVAWRERIETAERGVVARWAGSAWTIVGGRDWAQSASPPSPPTLVLHAGQSPVIGSATDNAISIARMNGPKVAALGLANRAPLAGCAFSAANPPARLLQTGCFTLPAPGRPLPHAGLVPYDIVSELWSDGARKRRWIALPAGASMSLSSTGAWSAPAGTFIIKEFALETTPNAPATRRAIETRVLVRDASGWQGFSYRWRPNGSDADLLTDGELTYDWPLDAGGTHTHVYPSRSQCLSCHEGSYGPLLGLRPQQLQRWYDYNGVIADQIDTLASVDVGPASSVAPFAAPHDASASVEARVRGYMAANCAHCHNPNHIAIKDLRYTTPLAQTRLCESIVPGSPPQSILYARLAQRPGMPPLATLAPDPLATDLVGRWITAMTSCP